MTENDPFARLDAGLAQPRQAKPEPPTDRQIMERVEADFASLFDGIRKFDTILMRHGEWNARFSWLNVDSNRIAHGLLNLHKEGRVVEKLDLAFQGRGVWFANRDFIAVANRAKENGNWLAGEVDDLLNSLSTYIERVVEKHG